MVSRLLDPGLKFVGELVAVAAEAVRSLSIARGQKIRMTRDLLDQHQPRGRM